MKLSNFEEWYSSALQKSLDGVDSIIKEIKQTSAAFPEQYELFDEHNDQIGYIRIRHGEFTVWAPDLFKDLLLKEQLEVCFGMGNFRTEEERIEKLKEAIDFINGYYEYDGGTK